MLVARARMGLVKALGLRMYSDIRIDAVRPIRQGSSENGPLQALGSLRLKLIRGCRT